MTERRVYLLDADLLGRVRAFQEERGIAHEVEAVRRLILRGLEAGEGCEVLCARLQLLPDLMTVRREAAGHSRVRSIEVGADSVTIGFLDGPSFVVFGSDLRP